MALSSPRTFNSSNRGSRLGVRRLNQKKTEPPPKPEVRLVPPKLLPAKGETTRRPGETDDETNDDGDEGKV